MTTTQPRQQKTPRQRAEETLAVAQRRFDRLTDAHAALVDEMEDLDEQLLNAGARLDYARQDPALQEGTSTTHQHNDQGGTTRMTEKNAYTAKVRGKGLDNTGVTEDIAKQMYNTLERRTLAIVEVEHKRRIDDVDTGRGVELVIVAFEPSQDSVLDDHLRQLMRTLHQNRVLTSEDTQLTIDTAGDLEPNVEDVIAAQRAHQAGQPHIFDPAEDGDDCIVCGEDLEHQLHVVVEDPAVEPDDDEPDDDQPADVDETQLEHAGT